MDLLKKLAISVIATASSASAMDIIEKSMLYLKEYRRA